MCTLLLCHGADPTLTNCHSKSALDLAASAELQAKIECKLIGKLVVMAIHVIFKQMSSKVTHY